eukprot:scaffold21262_cov30-Tisochrysis_lutea.AAC.1
MSSCPTRSTLSIRLMSSEIPPRVAWMCPSSDVPDPNGTRAVALSLQSLTTARTASTDCGNATAAGGMGTWCDSSSPWRWRMEGLVLTRHTPSSRRSKPSSSTGARTVERPRPRRRRGSMARAQSEQEARSEDIVSWVHSKKKHGGLPDRPHQIPQVRAGPDAVVAKFRQFAQLVLAPPERKQRVHGR